MLASRRRVLPTFTARFQMGVDSNLRCRLNRVALNFAAGCVWVCPLLLCCSTVNGAAYSGGVVNPPKSSSYGSFPGYTPWGSTFTGGYVGAGTLVVENRFDYDATIATLARSDMGSWSPTIAATDLPPAAFNAVLLRAVAPAGTSASMPTSTGAVPEPTSVAAIAFAGCSLFALRFRNKSSRPGRCT